MARAAAGSTTERSLLGNLVTSSPGVRVVSRRSLAPAPQPTGHARSLLNRRGTRARCSTTMDCTARQVGLDGRRAGWSVGAAGAEHGADGAGQDGEVLEHRPVVHVVEVEPDRLGPGEVGAPGDLPEAGHAGADVETAGHGVVVLRHLVSQRWARADQAHVAGEHVE